MSDLFKKLNTLVNAKIRDAISLDLSDVSSKLNPRLERDAKRLRERINEAIDYEDKLQAKVDVLKQEITQIDQAVDEAVNSGQEGEARDLIRLLTQAQRRLEFAEADLRQHRIVAEDLIRQVNMMEAAIADVQQTEQSSVPDETSGSQASIEKFNEVLNRAQDSLNRLRGRASTQIEQEDLAENIDERLNEARVEADIEARRKRLSGPPKQP